MDTVHMYVGVGKGGVNDVVMVVTCLCQSHWPHPQGGRGVATCHVHHSTVLRHTTAEK